MKRVLGLAVAVLLGSFIASAQTNEALSHATRAADLQGDQILERAIAAAGGRQAWQELKEFQARGSFSLYSAGKVVDSGNAVLAGSGLKRFRLTATLSRETRSWLWNDGNGSLTAGNIHSGEAEGKV